MEKMKRYPKLALASLILLIAALAMFWANWMTLKQSSMLRILTSVIPALENGGISFAEGRSLIGDLSQLSKNVGSILGLYADTNANSALSPISVLNIAYQVLFFGSFLAVVYCIYARLTWKSGLIEGIYFLFFIGDMVIMNYLMTQLNSICGSGTFRLSAWGFIALVCALLSEILWEEASFNTPNPLVESKKESSNL